MHLFWLLTTNVAALGGGVSPLAILDRFGATVLDRSGATVNTR